MAIAVSVNGLTKHFNYYKKELGFKQSFRNLFHREKLLKEAVKGISFEVEEGEIIGFLGPNGAGKTTTLKMLSGILYPTAGNATVLGYTPWERKKEFKMQYSIIMGQKSQLWWDLPANESLYLNKCMYEIDDKVYKKRVDELADILSVQELLDVQVRRLSLGERMKMELIASLLHNPKLLFLDEPTIGLDVISQKKIREFFKYHNQEHKTTIILTSHYLSDIEDLCKRAIVISHGDVVFNDNLEKINETLQMKKIMQLQFNVPVTRDVLDQYGTIREFNGYTAKLEVDKDKMHQVSKDVLEKLPIADFAIGEVPIEEGIELIYQK